MGLFGKSKKELLTWQNLVFQDSPNKLIMSERQLKQLTEQQAGDDLRIIQDCIKIISDTIKPDIFFSRLELLKEKSKHLIQLESYINFSGASPSAAFKEVIANEQQAIYQFIGRYYNATFEKAKTLKTDKGKKNQFKKFYDSLQLYTDKMNEHNIKYIEYIVKDLL